MPWLVLRVKIKLLNSSHGWAPCQLGCSPRAGMAIDGSLGGSSARIREPPGEMELKAETVGQTVKKCIQRINNQ